MGVKLTVNQLNEAWIASGDKVTDFNDQINMALNDDNFSAEAMSELKNKRDNEKVRRDALREQLVEAQAEQVVNMREEDKAPLTKKENNLKEQFVSDFVNMVRNPMAFLNTVSSNDTNGDNGNDSAAGLTIPQDIRTMINTLVRQYDSLQQYVRVESVSTSNGSRVYEKWTDVTPLTVMDAEDGEIPDLDNPRLTIIKYLIKRYAGIITATNTLLKDTAENILAWLSSWIAKKVVVTRNKAIIAVMQAAPKKPTIANFDDVITMINTSVDPAIIATSSLLTNQSGLNKLALVKTAEGKYLLESDPTKPNSYLVKGKQVIVVADRWLPNGGTTNAPVYPLYYGDMSQAITLFDRENMSLLPTNIGAGAFETDTTKIRVIDRFDVKATDSEALVAGSFTAIADQEGNFKTTTTTAG
ncbi:phage major capsid protein [Lactococcus lactis]|uniref:phage major capsid protein n=1 Tax=Lactococcus lactis TaxID=1358 RepID=UPI00210B342A|nr:phage major capsid protein [Lactococcus lactis]MCQ4972178.1 phage major capsid protein [Lactococcus lactis]MCQ4997984.1 phage major capsid protein [Lactococcus lactis]